MPTPYIKKLSHEGKDSVPALEKKWDKAKEAAGKQGHAKDYGYVTNIFKNMAHAGLRLQAKSRLLATEGHWEEGIGHLEYYDENGTMAAVIRVLQQGRKLVDVFEVDIPGKPKKYFGSTSTGATHQDLYDAKTYVVKECKGKGLVASHIPYIPDTKLLEKLHIDRWFDRAQRHWVVTLKDDDDNQHGDTVTTPNKSEALKMKKEDQAFNIRDYDAENAQRYRTNKPTKSKGK